MEVDGARAIPARLRQFAQHAAHRRRIGAFDSGHHCAVRSGVGGPRLAGVRKAAVQRHAGQQHAHRERRRRVKWLGRHRRLVGRRLELGVTIREEQRGVSTAAPASAVEGELHGVAAVRQGGRRAGHRTAITQPSDRRARASREHPPHALSARCAAAHLGRTALVLATALALAPASALAPALAPPAGPSFAPVAAFIVEARRPQVKRRERHRQRGVPRRLGPARPARVPPRVHDLEEAAAPAAALV